MPSADDGAAACRTDAGSSAAGVPWLARALPLVVLLAVLAAIFVFTAFAAPRARRRRRPWTRSRAGAGADVGDCVLVAGGHVSRGRGVQRAERGSRSQHVGRSDGGVPVAGERRIDGRDGSSALCRHRRLIDLLVPAEGR